MEELIKNIEKGKVLVLKDLLDYKNGDVISKTISQNSHESITLFSFTKGEGLSSHSAGGDALLNILEGEVKVTINDEDFILHEGESIVIKKGSPHALEALTNFKMLLVIVF